MTLRRADVVACDETGVRIGGSNTYRWLSHSAAAVVHTASSTRGAVVVRAMMEGAGRRCGSRTATRLESCHAAEHQTCLARLASDVAYVVRASDGPVPWRLQLWLQHVFALAQRVTCVWILSMSRFSGLGMTCLINAHVQHDVCLLV